jgi:hypothetical protein
MNEIELFGYNFRREALPSVELIDSLSGKSRRKLLLSPAYVTQFEKFSSAKPGDKIRLLWPDTS